MLNLYNTTHKVTVDTSATAAIHCTVDYVDRNTSTEAETPSGNEVTISSIQSGQDITGSPSSGVVRNIRHILLENVDPTNSNILTIKAVRASTVTMRVITLLAGESIEWDGTKWITFDATGAMYSQTRSCDIQTFITAGAATWTKPTGAKMVDIVAIGGGGAGGAGIVSTAAGGGGGGGGCYARKVFLASDLSATLTLAIGAKGVGGATKSAATASTVTDGSNVILKAGFGAIGADATSGSGGAGGAGGGAGTLVAAAAGSPGTQASGGVGAGGGTGATTGGIGGKGDWGGGGGGGGKNAAGTGTGGTSEYGGGGGGGGGTTAAVVAGGVGGDGIAANGAQGGSASAGDYTMGGTGGTGGGSGTTTGGNGAQPGGGGGGGGNAANSGGNGGDGAIVITTYF